VEQGLGSVLIAMEMCLLHFKILPSGLAVRFAPKCVKIFSGATPAPTPPAEWRILGRRLCNIGFLVNGKKMFTKNIWFAELAQNTCP